MNACTRNISLDKWSLTLDVLIINILYSFISLSKSFKSKLLILWKSYLFIHVTMF